MIKPVLQHIRSNLSIKLCTVIILCIVMTNHLMATENAGNVISGLVVDKASNDVIPGAICQLVSKQDGRQLAVTTTNEAGKFKLFVKSEPNQMAELLVTSVGFQKQKIDVMASKDSYLVVGLQQLTSQQKQVEVIGHHSEGLGRSAPTLVNTVSQATLRSANALSLADGLSYTPGLRVENNCQNCGFTSVRLNGLQGPYTQILINNRPTYSALSAVYGLEQIPASSIERIEVVRGAGSVLYGANAIAGTVNILTRKPVTDSWQVGHSANLVGGRSFDHQSTLAADLVSSDDKAGISMIGQIRDRQAFDANGDGFTEITKLQSSTLGFNSFIELNKYNRLKVNAFSINEYRRGGDQLELPPHQAQVAEELKTNAYNLGFDLFSQVGSLVVNSYASAQLTNRQSYYGGGGRVLTSADTVLKPEDLLAINAYGQTRDLMGVVGFRITPQTEIDSTKFWNWIIGSEYLMNTVNDQLKGYGREIRQQTGTWGSFGQLTFQLNKTLRAVAGLRLDVFNLNGTYVYPDQRFENRLTTPVLVPRLALIQQLGAESRLRIGYAQGYRAPQAFDEDLHIESVGGSARYIRMAEGLQVERSNSFTASIENDHEWGGFDTKSLIEGFYNILTNPFILEDASESTTGGTFWTKRNGTGLSVYGVNFEQQTSFDQQPLALSIGGTIQTTQLTTANLLWQSDADQTVSTSELLRTPNYYGYLNASYKPTNQLSIDLTSVLTGPMRIAKLEDATTGRLGIRNTSAFYDLNMKVAYQSNFNNGLRYELAFGCQNILNQYQRDFDSGPTRDASYIYGPMQPQTFYISCRIGSFFDR